MFNVAKQVCGAINAHVFQYILFTADLLMASTGRKAIGLGQTVTVLVAEYCSRRPGSLL